MRETPEKVHFGVVRPTLKSILYNNQLVEKSLRKLGKKRYLTKIWIFCLISQNLHHCQGVIEGLHFLWLVCANTLFWKSLYNFLSQQKKNPKNKEKKNPKVYRKIQTKQY